MSIQNYTDKSLQIDYTTSPIARIHNDILLMIFMINANMDDDDNGGDDTREDHQRIIPTGTTLRAINTTRRSSQVDSLWRDLIIQSPVIWASLIDIPLLDHAGTHWRETVIRRTQISGLHVKGNISIGLLHDAGSWISGFLNANWKRVRKFDLVMSSDRRSESVSHAKAVASTRKAVSWLSRPAPALESFTITFPHVCHPLETGTTLFGGHAPLLRSFETRRMDAPIRQNPTWLPQLHLLQIFESSTPTFSSVDELYKVLSQMPHLERLSLEDATASPFLSSQRYPMHLSSLKKIQIKEGDRPVRYKGALTCWPLLNSIIPKPGCSVELTIKPIDTGEIDIPVLCRFARNYFSVHQPTNIELGSGLKSFWLTDFEGAAWGESPSQEPFFCLRVDTLGNVPMGDKKNCQLLEGMSFLTFPRASRISFVISTANSTPLSTPKFEKLLRSLGSAATLSATPPALHAICSSPAFSKATSPLFPKLKRLVVPDFRQPSEYDFNLVPLPRILSSFLTVQKAAGAPVSMFEYKADFQSGSFNLQNFTSLDKFKGLKVVWSTNEIGDGGYVCGSGKPEELNLAKKVIQSGVNPLSRPYVYEFLA